MAKANIEINPAYLVSRTEWEKSKAVVGHALAIERMNLEQFILQCEDKGIKPTLARYRKQLKTQYEEITRAKYEDDIKEMVELYQKEQVDTNE